MLALFYSISSLNAKPLNDCLSAPTQYYLVSSINRTMAECAGDVPPAGELLRLHVLFLTKLLFLIVEVVDTQLCGYVSSAVCVIAEGTQCSPLYGLYISLMMF